MKFNVDFILTLFIFALLNHPTKSFIKLHASFEIKNLIGPLPIDIKNSIQPNIIPNLSAISYNLPILKNQKVKKLKLNKGNKDNKMESNFLAKLKSRREFNKLTTYQNMPTLNDTVGEKTGYWIENMNTVIEVFPDTCDGLFTQKINYHFQRGRFSSIMYKLSLTGTVDDSFGVSVISKTP